MNYNDIHFIFYYYYCYGNYYYNNVVVFVDNMAHNKYNTNHNNKTQMEPNLPFLHV